MSNADFHMTIMQRSHGPCVPTLLSPRAFWHCAGPQTGPHPGLDLVLSMAMQKHKIEQSCNLQPTIAYFWLLQQQNGGGRFLAGQVLTFCCAHGCAAQLQQMLPQNNPSMHVQQLTHVYASLHACLQSTIGTFTACGCVPCAVGTVPSTCRLTQCAKPRAGLECSAWCCLVWLKMFAKA